MTFSSFSLDSTLLKAITESAYDEPTEIQKQSIPLILAKHDVMARAQTGTGKTAAFALPILQKIIQDQPCKHDLKALVLTPTRELAQQVYKSFCHYGQFTALNMGIAYGGVSTKTQVKEIKAGVDVLIATPGRLLDLLRTESVSLAHIETLVFDEADRMLDMGFVPDIRKIYNATSKKQQMLMFSATFDAPIQKIAQEFLTEPVTISIKPDVSGHKNIKQLVYFSDNQTHKQQLLNHFIKNDEVTQAIIFTATKRMADQLSDQLYHSDIKTSALHGDMSQGSRTKTINRFKRNETKILVATDLASRGIDVQNISHVFNYDMPRFAEDYIHRIGRTGRAGAAGEAISLVCSEETEYQNEIEKLLNEKLDSEIVKGFEPTDTAEPKRAATQSKSSFGKKKKPSTTANPEVKSTKKKAFFSRNNSGNSVAEKKFKRN